MAAFLAALTRILFGFALACLAAGLVKVFFAVVPGELNEAGQYPWDKAGLWWLHTTIVIASFAGILAAIPILLSEGLGIRSFAYHALVGIAISLAGFGLLMSQETGNEPTIVNSYAMAAYLTTGFVFGLVYWLFSGRRAHRPRTIETIERRGPAPQSAPPPAAPVQSAEQKTHVTAPTSRPDVKPTSASVPATTGEAAARAAKPQPAPGAGKVHPATTPVRAPNPTAPAANPAPAKNPAPAQPASKPSSVPQAAPKTRIEGVGEVPETPKTGPKPAGSKT